MRNSALKVLLVLQSLFLVACASTDSSSKKSLDALALVEIANDYYEKGLLSDAEAKYRRITREYPKYHEAWLKLGNIYIRTDQLDAAIIAYETCNKKQPEDVRCWNNLALARVKQAVSSLDVGKAAMMKNSDEYLGLENFQMKLISILATE